MNIRIFRSIAIVVILSLALFAVIGCEDGVNMTSSVIGGGEPPEAVVQEPTESGGTPGPELLAVGKMKQPVETDQIVEEPSDTVSPTVVDVGFYRDWQLMHKLTMADAVYPGDTVYITVVFSEPVRHSVADDETARPALSFVLDGQVTRFRVAAHGAHGEDFFSGVCKPLHGSVSSYLCKVMVPTDISGTLALEVGTGTVDRAGNPVAEATIHTAPFMVEMEMVMPEPVDEEPMGQEMSPEGRAEEILRRIHSLQNEDDAINDFERRYEIVEEESGLSYYSFIRGPLLDIYFEEKPEERGNSFSWYDFVLEYLRLGFAYPEASEQDLLDHFRQSVRDGRVTIVIHETVMGKKFSEESRREREVVSQAVAIWANVGNRETEAYFQWKQDKTFDLVLAKDKIFQEEAGLSFDFVHNTLFGIYLEEVPEDKYLTSYEFIHHAGLIKRYITYSIMYPDEEEDQLLERFRQACVKGKFYF